MIRTVTLVGVSMAAAALLGLWWVDFFSPHRDAQTVREQLEHNRGSATPAEPATLSAAVTVRLGEPEVIAEQLEIPWDIGFLPDGTMLVTERTGTLLHMERGERYRVPGVRHIGEGGLLGLALHPDFATNRFLYLYHTTETDDGLRNRVVRYRFTDDRLRFDRVIFDNIPGARYHDGGRIRFGPDGYLYITTGDAGDPALAQNTESRAGKVLRITDEGEIPADNPFGNAVYTYGHRNPQGLAWDEAGRLWSSEHGRSVPKSGFDEINLLVAGENYGWPESEGGVVEEGTVGPALHSGPDTTWAPASAAVAHGTLFVGGLRGRALYAATLSEEAATIVDFQEHFQNEFGRIRSVAVSPSGDALYFTTSNRDGRGRAREEDDVIVRVPFLFE